MNFVNGCDQRAANIWFNREIMTKPPSKREGETNRDADREPKSQHTYNDISFGEMVFGVRVPCDNLKNRATAVDFSENCLHLPDKLKTI